MAAPKCHYCGRSAEAECSTCGRFYCAEHGDDVCLRCMAPESAAPAAGVYRGSVVALIAATAVAVFLLVNPPESKSTTDIARPLATSTSATGATATATPSGQATPTRPAGQTAAASPSAAGTAGTTPAPNKTYTVKPGDTLGAIAAANGTTIDAILALNPGVTPETLQIGAVINLP